MFRWRVSRPTLAAGLVIVALFAASILMYSGCGTGADAAGKLSQADMIKRGEYLVTTSGCHDCHTPKKMTPEGVTMDMSLALSGHPAEQVLTMPAEGVLTPTAWMASCNAHLTAWAGPWGISYAANLTPDQVTGIGSWTPEAFAQAIRTGKHLGAGRQILPPMPWENYAKFTDEDLMAIFAYLHSIKPIQNQVPQPTPPIATGH